MGNEKDNLLGKNIQHLREIHGETLSELGDAVFLGNTAIKNYESGTRDPKPQVLASIAKHFGKTVDELMQSDLSGLGEIDCSLHGVTQFLDLWKIMFPLFKSDEAMKNEDFRKAYNKCTSVLDSLSRNEEVAGHVWSDCFELFLSAVKAEVPEAVANLFWLVFMDWSSIMDQKMRTAYTSLIYSRKNQQTAAKTILKINSEVSEEVIKKRREFIEEFDDFTFELIKALKSDLDWSDLGDYYLGMKYLLGMVDSGFSQEMNKTIGTQMLLAQVQLDNKYAVRTLITVFSV